MEKKSTKNKKAEIKADQPQAKAVFWSWLIFASAVFLLLKSDKSAKSSD